MRVNCGERGSQEQAYVDSWNRATLRDLAMIKAAIEAVVVREAKP
jgi:hypothetical protein